MGASSERVRKKEFLKNAIGLYESIKSIKKKNSIALDTNSIKTKPFPVRKVEEPIKVNNKTSH